MPITEQSSATTVRRTSKWILGATSAAIVFVVVNDRLRQAFRPIIYIPMSIPGITRSPPFQIREKGTYDILIGLKPMQVAEKDCAPAIEAAQGISGLAPCHELRPPIGARTWKVKRDGTLVMAGVMAAEKVDGARMAKLYGSGETMSWANYGGWVAEPGDNYIIEIDTQPSSVDLRQYTPRLAIVRPWK